MAMWEVFIVINGHNENVLNSWRRTRMVAYGLTVLNMNFVAVHSKKAAAKKIPSIEKFMPLPGDDEAAQVRGKSLKERLQERRELYKKLGAI